MRRWLAILLLVLLPVQWAWGALAPVCEHQVAHALGTASHAGDDLGGDADLAADAVEAAADRTADCQSCHHCHGHGVGVLSAPPQAAFGPGAAPPRPAGAASAADAPAAAPDRPQWPRLA